MASTSRCISPAGTRESGPRWARPTRSICRCRRTSSALAVSRSAGEGEGLRRRHSQTAATRRSCRRTDYAVERKNTELYRVGVPRVARALANCATYMIFDDHDVTDDWNLNKKWREPRVLEAVRAPARAQRASWRTRCSRAGATIRSRSRRDTNKIGARRDREALRRRQRRVSARRHRRDRHAVGRDGRADRPEAPADVELHRAHAEGAGHRPRHAHASQVHRRGLPPADLVGPKPRSAAARRPGHGRTRSHVRHFGRAGVRARHRRAARVAARAGR